MNEKPKLNAYKLFRVMANGDITSLFINKSRRLPLNEWLTADTIPTKGFKVRHGWHCTSSPKAPHLTNKGRVWMMVEMLYYSELKRPESQGGLWYLADQIRIINTKQNQITAGWISEYTP